MRLRLHHRFHRPDDGQSGTLDATTGYRLQSISEMGLSIRWPVISGGLARNSTCMNGEGMDMNQSERGCFSAPTLFQEAKSLPSGLTTTRESGIPVQTYRNLVADKFIPREEQTSDLPLWLASLESNWLAMQPQTGEEERPETQAGHGGEHHKANLPSLTQ